MSPPQFSSVLIQKVVTASKGGLFRNLTVQFRENSHEGYKDSNTTGPSREAVIIGFPLLSLAIRKVSLLEILGPLVGCKNIWRYKMTE